MGRLTGWTIFSVRGVEVSLHVSLLFLLFYVILIASIQLDFVIAASGLSADQISGTPLLWSAIFAFSLLVSVLVHELGHVFVAQAKGAKVKRITLMMLGGVSEIEEIPKDPASEFKIAIIGPLVSLALGALLLAFRDFTDSPNISFFAFWIGRLNVILGIFNLLPAYPMDGGRVLRAWMSSRYGHVKGTEKAFKVSRVFAWTFGILGILQFNILLILIAFLIYFSARSELFILTSQEVLGDAPVRNFMVSVPVLSPHLNLHEAAHVMFHANSTILPVEGDPPGLLTVEAFSRVPKQLWGTTRVEQIKASISNPQKSESPLRDILTAGSFTSLGGLPVIDQGKIVGIIRLRDVLECIQLGVLVREEKRPAPKRAGIFSRPAGTT